MERLLKGRNGVPRRCRRHDDAAVSRLVFGAMPATFTEARISDLKEGPADRPSFAAVVRVANRALAERIGARTMAGGLDRSFTSPER